MRERERERERKRERQREGERGRGRGDGGEKIKRTNEGVWSGYQNDRVRERMIYI